MDKGMESIAEAIRSQNRINGNLSESLQEIRKLLFYLVALEAATAALLGVRLAPIP